MSALTRLLPLLLCVVMTTTHAYAQEGPKGRWWLNPRVAKQLQLTQSEINSLENAFEASRLKMIKLKSEVETEQFRLQNMIEQPVIDTEKLKEQNRKLEKARSALADERFAFLVELRDIIGHRRFQELLSMYPSSR